MDWLFYFKLPAIGFVQHLASILSIPSVQAPKSLVVSPRWPPLPNSYILPWSASFTARCTFTTIFIADTFTKKETASMYDILKRDEVGSDKCSWHTWVLNVFNNNCVCFRCTKQRTLVFWASLLTAGRIQHKVLYDMNFVFRKSLPANCIHTLCSTNTPF